jgi:hypothetical protein
MLDVLPITVAVCVLGLLASVLISRASNLSPAANVALAGFLVLVLAGLSIAAFAFLSGRAFPD